MTRWIKVATALALVAAAGASSLQAQDGGDARSALEAAMAVSPTAAGLAARHERWAREAPDDGAQRIEELRRLAERDRAARALRVSAGSLVEACVAIALDACSSPMGGYLAFGDDPQAPAPRLYWQTQAGTTPEDGLKGGFVLLTEEGDRLVPAVWDFEGYVYQPPVLLESDGDGVVIAVAGTYAGSGGHSGGIL